MSALPGSAHHLPRVRTALVVSLFLAAGLPVFLGGIASDLLQMLCLVQQCQLPMPESFKELQGATNRQERVRLLTEMRLLIKNIEDAQKKPS